MAKSDKKYLLVAQEIKLAKILAGNNKKLRERTLKRLRKWLCDRTAAAPVSEDFFMRIWKGLFYTMWMSDKPLIQEECAENISKLVHIGDIDASLLFFKCFLQTMVNEWFGIDYHRLDKFLMLVRRVLRQIFEVLKETNWNHEHLDTFKEILNQTALKVDNSSALGLAMHIDEVYLEELAKISKGKLSMDAVSILLQPFAQQLARVQDLRQVKHISEHIFKYLMFQSDAGIEYQERFQKWKQLGYPGATPDVLEKVELDNDDENEDEEQDTDEMDDVPKDPRAGKVDVVLPQVPFDAGAIADMLLELRVKPYTNTRSRKTITRLAEAFKELARGTFPLGIKSVATVNNDGYSTKVKSSLKRLHNFEQSIAGTTKNAKSKAAKKRKIREIISEELEKYEMDEKPKQKQPKTSNNYDAFVANSEAGLFGNKTHAHSPQEGNKKKKRKRVSENGAELLNGSVTKCKKPKETVNGETKKVKQHRDDSVEAKIVNSNKFVRNSGVWHVDEFEAPAEEPKVTDSVKNDWAKPLADGEMDFFVVSNKTKKKLKRLSESKGRPVSELVNELSTSILNGKQNTPKKNIVKNPFSESTPSRGEKKIKFALNLNKSQDISEHISQVISSPGNPYDATKRPVKPLLKPSPMASPINPFYRKKFRH